MKTCPYCKESVHDEAIKCRFCQSMLLPLAPTASQTPDSGRTTYILDQDLVRFGKFASAVLAVFLVVGAYLFGFKLDSALDKVHNTQEDLKNTQEKLETAQRELEAAQKTVGALKTDVETVLGEAKRSLAEISAQRTAAIELVVSMRKLTPPEAAALPALKAEQPEKVRRDPKSKYWANGATVRIRFLDGDAKSQEEVKRVVREWANYVNLTFEFLQAGDSEVRVSFNQVGSWSFLGTDALVVPQDQPTINLQVVDRRTILHEFGHVLGLIEEHLNPKANIHWDKALVYDALSGPPNFWSQEVIEASIFKKIAADELGSYRDFDPHSVMTMSLAKAWTGGVEMGGHAELTESDKALVSQIYPKPK